MQKTTQTEVKISFGNRIRNLRKKSNMTQEDLADKMVMSSRNISDIENGSVDHYTTIVSLAEAFDITIYELFFDEPEDNFKVYTKSTLLLDYYAQKRVFFARYFASVYKM